MGERAKSLPEYSVIREMPCIGDALAPRIIAEIGAGTVLDLYRTIDEQATL